MIFVRRHTAASLVSSTAAIMSVEFASAIEANRLPMVPVGVL
jgi:hypothetical protein